MRKNDGCERLRTCALSKNSVKTIVLLHETIVETKRDVNFLLAATVFRLIIRLSSPLVSPTALYRQEYVDIIVPWCVVVSSYQLWTTISMSMVLSLPLLSL